MLIHGVANPEGEKDAYNEAPRGQRAAAGGRGAAWRCAGPAAWRVQMRDVGTSASSMPLCCRRPPDTHQCARQTSKMSHHLFVSRHPQRCKRTLPNRISASLSSILLFSPHAQCTYTPERHDSGGGVGQEECARKSHHALRLDLAAPGVARAQHHCRTWS